MKLHVIQLLLNFAITFFYTDFFKYTVLPCIKKHSLETYQITSQFSLVFCILLSPCCSISLSFKVLMHREGKKLF